MATTTNYGFEIPDDTDLVKDGALAMRDLGQDVDTQLFTALGGDYPGLRLVKKQTIGTSITSVEVTGAFSATYDNYLIIVSGGVGSTNAFLNFRLGSTATGYYRAGTDTNYATGTTTSTSFSNGGAWSAAGQFSSSSMFLNINIFDPFLTKVTKFNSNSASTDTLGSSNQQAGFLNDTTSYTAFTIIANSGNFTGGTIYVYGYGAS
jgi:hypothetical protein